MTANCPTTLTSSCRAKLRSRQRLDRSTHGDARVVHHSVQPLGQDPSAARGNLFVVGDIEEHCRDLAATRRTSASAWLRTPCDDIPSRRAEMGDDRIAGILRAAPVTKTVGMRSLPVRRWDSAAALSERRRGRRPQIQAAKLITGAKPICNTVAPTAAPRTVRQHDRDSQFHVHRYHRRGDCRPRCRRSST